MIVIDKDGYVCNSLFRKNKMNLSGLICLAKIREYSITKSGIDFSSLLFVDSLFFV